MIYPKFLKDGDTIGITALSMGIDDKKLESFEKSIDNLHSKGFNTFFTSNVYSNEKLVSSSSTTRAKEFNDLVTDDKINVIMSARGGDFIFDCLEFIDYSLLLDNPKWVQGYSDPTSLLFTITTKYDIATIYGNNAGSYDEEHKCYDDSISILKGDFPIQNSFSLNPTDWKCLNGSFEESGILIGGCIECLRFVIGTEYDNVSNFVNKYKKYGFIWYFDLFDITSYDLYNVLVQFKNAGWFKYAKAFIFGRVCIPNTIDDSYSYEDAIKDALGDTNIVINADIGHIRPTFSIINGALGNISVKDNNATLKMSFIDKN